MSSTIDQAVQYYSSTDSVLIRGTARAWDISPNTLLRRVNRCLTGRDSHYTQQILSAMQENMLVSWIVQQERIGSAPTHQRVCEFAACIRACTGEDPYVGKNWPERILSLNPAARTKIGRKIGHQRVQNTQPEVLKHWFRQFQGLVSLYKVDSAYI